MNADALPPPGWGPMLRTSPLLDHLGGFHSRGRGTELELGLRVLPQHANSRGTTHGGVIATLADTALGYLLAYRTDPPRALVTSSLTVDYLSPAAVGEWIEAKCDAWSAWRSWRGPFAEAGAGGACLPCLPRLP